MCRVTEFPSPVQNITKFFAAQNRHDPNEVFDTTPIHGGHLQPFAMIFCSGCTYIIMIISNVGEESYLVQKGYLLFI